MKANTNKFKVGQLVLMSLMSTSGEVKRIGIVKEIHGKIIKLKQKETISYRYTIIDNDNNISITLGESLLEPIVNERYFLIIRRNHPTISIDDTPARALAARIIDAIPQLSSLQDVEYYHTEDVLTNLINSYTI